MCYAIPGKVVEIDGKNIVLDYFGEKRKVFNEFSYVVIGDYVYAQGGIVITKVDFADAQKTLEYWKEEFFKLKKIDSEVFKVENIKASDNILRILQKVNLNKELTRDEILRLLDVSDKDELKLIYETANNIRKKEHDNSCCVHGIIEFSNHCSNNCYCCGIRKDKDISRYRMSVEEIIKVARNAVEKLGFRAIVLQSGEDGLYDCEKLVKIVKEIRKLGVLIFISIGIRSTEVYDKLYDAGARAVLLRFETSNKNIFEKIRPGTSFDERINLIKWLKNRGYLIATGFVVGFPGETDLDIVNNILLTKELSSDMYSFGPLIPVSGTPLENVSKVSYDMILKIISISRFVDRKSKILVTTALETLDSGLKKKGLLSGANSLMINVTPKKYKEKYLIYDRKNYNDINLEINDTIKLLKEIGRAPIDIGI